MRRYMIKKTKSFIPFNRKLHSPSLLRYHCKHVEHHIRTCNFPQVKQYVSTNNCHWTDLNSLLEIANQEKNKVIKQKNEKIKNPEYIKDFTESGIMAFFNWSMVSIILFGLHHGNLNIVNDVTSSLFLYFNVQLGILTGLRTLYYYIQTRSRKNWCKRYLSISKIQKLLDNEIRKIH